MEIYKNYQSDLIKNPLSRAHIAESDDGVTLLLYSESIGEPLKFLFENVLAFRRVMEEACIFRFEGNWENPDRQGAVFIVENSRWVSKFSEAELIHYPDPTHYVFMTDWQIIEILACSEPILQVRNVVDA